MIEDVEDDINELPDSDFSKSAVRIFDKIDNGKCGVLPSSKFGDFIQTREEGFHSEELVGNMRKLDPDESGNLERFAYLR